jgi:hypothetical protein
MPPLRRFALPHPASPSPHDLKRIRLQVDADKQQPILGRGQRTVLLGRVAAGGTRLPIEALCRHVRLEHGCQWWDQRPNLLSGETGEIEHLDGAGLHVSEPSRSHSSGLRSSEAQDTINRD